MNTNSAATTTALYGAGYTQLENSALCLAPEARFHLTHVLLQSIEEGSTMPPERKAKWAAFEERANESIESGMMATADAFDALATIRHNLKQSAA